MTLSGELRLPVFFVGARAARPQTCRHSERSEESQRCFAKAQHDDGTCVILSEAKNLLDFDLIKTTDFYRISLALP